MSIGRMNEHLRKDEEAIKVKYCAKCKNHGLKEEMKGHKRECARMHCSCDKCQGTEKKRAKTRIQVQLRRIKLTKLYLEKAAKDKQKHEELMSKTRQGRSFSESPRTDKPDEQKHEEMISKTRQGRSFSESPRTDKAENVVSMSEEIQSAPLLPKMVNKTSVIPYSPPPLIPIPGLDKKPKRTWESVLALCEDFKFPQDCYPLLHLILKDFTIEEARDKIEQATKEVAEKVSEESGRMEAGQVGPHYPWLGPHYQHLHPRPSDLQAASLYKIPHLYPRPVPFGFPFPLIRATPYGFAHTVPSTTYTIPCHEPARPSVLSYDDFQKFENKRSSPCSHHSEEQSSFNQVEI